jgi:hypothetical protein
MIIILIGKCKKKKSEFVLKMDNAIDESIIFF